VGAVALAILAGMVPAGVALHTRLSAALEDRARRDLALAPRILADRSVATNDALMMHAKEFAHVPELVRALATGDRAAADRIANDQQSAFPSGIPVVVGPRGETWIGPTPDSSLLAATRAGQMPVELRGDLAGLRTIALAPVEQGGRWTGAAGFAIPLDDDAARTLAGLTRSEVVIVAASGRAVASTLDSTMTPALVQALTDGRVPSDSAVDVRAGSERVSLVTAPLGSAGCVVFARLMRRELAILPTLRRVALLSAIGALATALLLGAILATQVARPVRGLAQAARALGEGDFAAPLPRSRLEEVATVSTAFATMRDALAARLAELQAANRELEDRAARLAALQSDLLQRERLAASAQLVGHLAHEIRNPVATLRNLLEVIHRRVTNDPESREFVELAIDELLRMHELAERMLDLNRPRDPAVKVAHVGQVARDVARLVSAGDGAASEIVVVDDSAAVAAIAPDALKQILLNLVQNAREAVRLAPASAEPRIEIAVRLDGDTVRVRVTDNGPGIAPQALPRIFDPFFTTKESVHGVGLGLFVAEGIVRAAGGRLTARNHDEGGAEFRIELPGKPLTATQAAADHAVGTA
jgi:signal transduction histidine kinase